MCSSFWLLGVESRDFTQAEKERTACKAEQIYKMTTIFTQKDNLGHLSLYLWGVGKGGTSVPQALKLKCGRRSK